MQDNVFPFPSENTQCPLCGNHSGHVVWEFETFPYGVGEDRVLLTARVPVIHCEACGDQTTGDAAEEIRHTVICHHLGRLSPQEVRSVREQYGLSQQQWAKQSRLGIASVKRWELGNQIQNDAMDAYMRLLALPSNFEAVSSNHFAVKKIERHFSFRTDMSPLAIESSLHFALRKVN
jgi:DNA-binding transcriptional regulator YiaG